ncbi:MAG: antA/AntB antirepressor family protein [Sulfurovaceae bacterium]
MNIEIIKTKLNGNDVNSINSRELYEFLGSRQDYSTWIKSRLDDLGAVENMDFLLHKFVEQVPHQGGTRGQTKINYIITIHIAKHLAMMERNDKGKEARDYFIECEQKLTQTFQLPQNYLEALKALTVEVEAKEKLQLELKEATPYISFGKSVEASVNSVLIRDWVKALSKEENVIIGQNKAFSWLRRNNYLMHNNQPFQKYINNGYFEYIPITYATTKGVREGFITKITGKGQIALAQKIVDSFKYFKREVA